MAQYLALHLVDGVPVDNVWATMIRFAHLAAEGFVAKPGASTTSMVPFVPHQTRWDESTYVEWWNLCMGNKLVVQSCIGCAWRVA